METPYTFSHYWAHISVNNIVKLVTAISCKLYAKSQDRVGLKPYIIINNIHTSDFLAKGWNMSFLLNLTKKIGRMLTIFQNL